MSTLRGWAEARLESIADVQLGRQRSPKNHQGPNMRPYLRAANVTWNGISLDDVKQMHFSPEEVETFRLRPGDILLSEASGSAGEVGKPALWQGQLEDCCFQNTLIRVRSEHIAPAYLLWFFKWLALSGKFATGARGVGIHHLGARTLGGWTIPIPPIDEQKRIVAVIEEHLPKVDAGATALERARKAVQTLRSSIFQRTAPRGSWPEVEIAKTIRIVDYRGRTPPFSESGIPHLRSFNIKNGNVLWDGCAYVSPVTYEKYMSRGFPRPGDLLFTTEAPMGEVAFAPETQFCMAQRMMLLKPDEHVWLPEYLMYHLRSPWFQAKLRLRATGTTVQGISSRNFRPLTLAVPPLEEQRQLASTIRDDLASAEALERVVDAQLARVRRLRTSLLKAAFAGRLALQDPTDEPASVLIDRVVAERVSRGAKTNTRRAKETA